MEIHNSVTEFSEDYLKQLDNDFSRKIWCILGLPFDAVSMDQAVNTVVDCARNGSRCFISTPNLNFLCAAQEDAFFWQSVIDSDLSLADGMPIVVLARFLNIPITQRVAGSDLINCLNEKSTEQPLTVFFFGGESGVAAQASFKLNEMYSGLKSVGYYDPGFGSVDSMSSDAIIDEINRYDIDFLIVSLGAKKGQAWIEKNMDKLNAKVISHLGAVVNFFAGTVIRAPAWMQRLGLEWAWRIYQEPALWKRYFDDGRVFLKLIFSSVLPYRFWLYRNKKHLHSGSEVEIFWEDLRSSENLMVVRLSGNCCHHALHKLKVDFKKLVLKQCDVCIDMKGVGVIDGAFIGLCFLLQKHLMISGCLMKFVNLRPEVDNVLRWNGVQNFFS